ncbi:WecB/TagA/CpsF family glycosyltransferase [candidate division FCPU426 bacterium]|nr:WecB/TagA/CpsF family glycosyltransferase [candidate division FCPU426 bacterium]
MACQTLYTINILTLVYAQQDPQYAEALGRADLTVADGSGAAWVIKRVTGKKPERVAGIDLLLDLVRVCAVEKQGIFLLGGKPGVAGRSAGRLQRDFPQLRIAGTHDGYWPPEKEGDIVAAVNRSRASLLLVGLGQPRQEFFIDRHQKDLHVRMAMGVGGSFDVLAGDLQRAPRWMQRSGLEWLARCCQEPWRIRRLSAVPGFLWSVWRRSIHN